MAKKNIFVVGCEATGDSFFGRAHELSIFEDELIRSNNRGISLVGPTRIGKSSLIGELGKRLRELPKILWVTLSMGEMDDANSFWYSVCYEIQSTLEEKGLVNNNLAMDLYWMDAVFSTQNWYIQMNRRLKILLTKLKKEDIVLILNLDEFDIAPQVFEQQTNHFQLLRSLYSGGDYNVKGILSSRRRLPMIESNSDGLSTFHGVFQERTLGAFTSEDMFEISSSLGDYDIFIAEDGEFFQRLYYYANNIPYLVGLCLHRLVEIYQGEMPLDADLVDKIYDDLSPSIRSYYDDLIHRLRGDGLLEDTCKLCVYDLNYLETNRLNNSMEYAMGILESLGILYKGNYQGVERYYAFTQDFTIYLKVQNISYDSWDVLTQCELRMKDIFLQVYPQLDKYSYNTLLFKQEEVRRHLDLQYPKLNLDLNKMRNFGRDLNNHKKNPTLIDVITLNQIIVYIIRQWSEFQKCFPGEEAKWKDALNCIKEVRNPMAHSNAHHVAHDTMAKFNYACQMVIEETILPENATT